MDHKANSSSIAIMDNGSNSTMNATAHILSNRFSQLTVPVPEHWLHEGLPSRIELIFIGSLVSLCILFSYMANALWFYIFSRHKKLRTPANQLVASLFLADFIMTSKAWILVINAFAGGPQLGTSGCYSFGVFGTIAALVQIWSIMAISMERTNAICRPATRRGKINKIQSLSVICLIWTSAIFFAVMPLLGWSKYVPEAYMLGCTFDAWSSSTSARSYLYILIAIAYVIPLAVIVACYAAIFDVTKQTRKTLNDLSQRTAAASAMNSANSRTPNDPIQTQERKNDDTERRLALMVLVIVGIWALTWTPYAIVALMQQLGYGYLVSARCYISAVLFAKMSSIMNTFIYGLRLPHFRHHAARICPILAKTLLGVQIKSLSPASASRTRQMQIGSDRIPMHMYSYKRTALVSSLDSKNGGGKVKTTVKPSVARSTDQLSGLSTVSEGRHSEDNSRLLEVSLELERERVLFEEWRQRLEQREKTSKWLQSLEESQSEVDGLKRVEPASRPSQRLASKIPKHLLEEIQADLREITMESKSVKKSDV